MTRVVHFEIPADSPEGIRKFYGDVFGWNFEKWPGPQEYWMVKTGEGDRGIDGGMMQRPKDAPGGVVNTLGVESLDASITAVEKHGGTVVVPKCAIPGVGWLAYFNDPEGHTFGMMQFDELAK